jgi:AcrR family transcriptional regulator
VRIAPASAPTARERQRTETRERLFRAALDEIRGVGVTNAQVDRIVASVGVSRGTFYFHFPTKEDVLMEWERRRESEIIERLDWPAARGPSLRVALLEVIDFLTQLLSSPDERRLVLDTLAIHVRQGANPSSYPLLAEIERRLAAAVGRGEIRDDLDPRELAVLFLSNVFGFVVAHADPRQPHPKADVLVDVFLSGVISRRGARNVPRRASTRRRPGRSKQ